MTPSAAPAATPVTLTPLLGMPEVHPGDDLAEMVVLALAANGIRLADGDVLVVSSKIASKALGLTAAAQDRAEVVLRQSRRVVAERDTPLGVTRVVEAVAGPVMAAAGVDASNTGAADVVLLLPADPDEVARALRARIAQLLPGAAVGVILSDTAGRPWRVGQTDFALGAAGVHLVEDLRGGQDGDGRELSVTERCVGDEIAAAADLVKGKAAGVPVAHVRGLAPAAASSGDTPGARSLVRTGPTDWFGSGRVEAVRASLGVEAGTELAREVGIPSALPEPPATRVARARRVALLGVEGVSASTGPEGVVLQGEDAFTLGVAASRLVVALHGEGLVGRVERLPATGRQLQARVKTT